MSSRVWSRNRPESHPNPIVHRYTTVLTQPLRGTEAGGASFSKVAVSRLRQSVTYTLSFGAPRESVEFGVIAAPKPVTYSRFTKGPRLPYACDQILR